MKKLFLTLTLAFTCLLASAQYFEGDIVYHNTIKSKSPQLTDEQFTTMLGNTQNYYIKNGSYKSETNGTMVAWQLYVNSDNKLYTKLASSPALLWNDGAVNPDEVLSTELHKNAETILGYPCDELVLNCKSGVQKYYFNSKLSVNSKLYEKHAYGNWYAYLQKANALPLKLIIDNAQFTMESVAVQVKPMKLDDATFKLPAGVQTMKSPY